MAHVESISNLLKFVLSSEAKNCRNMFQCIGESCWMDCIFQKDHGNSLGLHNPGKLLVCTQDRCPLIYNGNTLLWTSQSTIHLLD